VAVLLNPVHKHADLVLPINTIEDRLFRQIDGKRTLGEIVRGYAEKDVTGRALPFFHKLWQFDQIVIDVSRTCEATDQVAVPECHDAPKPQRVNSERPFTDQSSSKEPGLAASLFSTAGSGSPGHDFLTS